MNADNLIRDIVAGRRIDVDEAIFLAETADTPALRDAAHAVRQEKRTDGTVTYLVDRNINYTNVCITDCKFCEFYRPPGHKESYVLSHEEMRLKIQETLDAGGTRILLQGGHNPELRIDWYVDLLRWIKGEFPTIELNAFSPSEIGNIADLEDMTIDEVLSILQSAGMDGLPGGGGEILDDEIRHKVSPKKQKTAEWIACMRSAHARGMVTSATQVIGFGETWRHRFNSLKEIRDLQDQSNAAGLPGFLSFIMWPLQHESRFGAVFGEKKGIELGASPALYLRHVALCRLFLDNIPHIAASWPTMGPESAQEALRFGADDFGSTMLEENVVSSAGSIHTCMTEDMMRGYIREAGFTPRKRNSGYEILECQENGPTLDS